jgi:hypothetical protein
VAVCAARGRVWICGEDVGHPAQGPEAVAGGGADGDASLTTNPDAIKRSAGGLDARNDEECRAEGGLEDRLVGDRAHGPGEGNLIVHVVGGLSRSGSRGTGNAERVFLGGMMLLLLLRMALLACGVSLRGLVTGLSGIDVRRTLRRHRGVPLLLLWVMMLLSWPLLRLGLVMRLVILIWDLMLLLMRGRRSRRRAHRLGLRTGRKRGRGSAHGLSAASVVVVNQKLAQVRAERGEYRLGGRVGGSVRGRRSVRRGGMHRWWSCLYVLLRVAKRRRRVDCVGMKHDWRKKQTPKEKKQREQPHPMISQPPE